jgi:predicted O-methyltransferase YrrM
LSTSATATKMAEDAAAPASARAPQLVFGITILASACLLFLVQPLISKLILPWFGGSAAVWITCMLFFQTGLLVGYLYAHALVRYLSTYQQTVVHALLLLASIAVLPILPNAAWVPKPGEDPTWKVLAVLATSVGLPYALLSSTSPLLQSWYAARKSSGLPYRYFALSNGGSMAALLLYPVAIEPFLKGRNQAWLWSGAFFLFALLCIFTAALASRTTAVCDPVALSVSEKAPGSVIGLWIALAACASTLLLTVTNLLTQNIAPMPLLWVLPLSIYLFSFILCFESARWYRRWVFLPALPFALYWLASHTETIETPDVMRVVPLICAALFVCCMVCHGELAHLKPGVVRLTAFYLSLSVGGALGGVFVALIAPHLFSAMYEYPISYLACPVLVLVVLRREKANWWKWKDGQLAESLWLLAIAGILLLAAYGAKEMKDELTNSVAKGRNFYGALLVEDYQDDEHKLRQLSHGTITHGIQIQDRNFRQVPTTYYGRESGAGLTWRVLETKGSLKLGVVGLGTGTMAAYGRAGDTVRFYDLNPLVIDFAHKYFTFLADCPAHVDVVLGDARLSLAREPSQEFDMLVIDAFAGDAIPVHLLTREAFDIYWRHLKPGGVLAVHVSNQYLNLAPIVCLDAKARSMPAWQVNNDTDDSISVDAASYVLVSRRAGFFEDPLFEERLKTIDIPRHMRPWTDDFTSLWPILRIGPFAKP